MFLAKAKLHQLGLGGRWSAAGPGDRGPPASALTAEKRRRSSKQLKPLVSSIADQSRPVALSRAHLSSTRPAKNAASAAICCDHSPRSNASSAGCSARSPATSSLLDGWAHAKAAPGHRGRERTPAAPCRWSETLDAQAPTGQSSAGACSETVLAIPPAPERAPSGQYDRQVGLCGGVSAHDAGSPRLRPLLTGDALQCRRSSVWRMGIRLPACEDLPGNDPKAPNVGPARKPALSQHFGRHVQDGAHLAGHAAAAKA